MQNSNNPTFAGLLRSAVDEPGTLSSAYQQFLTATASGTSYSRCSSVTPEA